MHCYEAIHSFGQYFYLLKTMQTVFPESTLKYNLMQIQPKFTNNINIRFDI